MRDVLTEYQREDVERAHSKGRKVCFDCMSRSCFNGKQAMCFTFGIGVSPYSIGCVHMALTKEKAQTKEPTTPVCREHGSPLAINRRDFSGINSIGQRVLMIVETGQILGKWYAGHEFGTYHGNMYGSYCGPCMFDKCYETEDDAIRAELRLLLWYAERECNKETAEFVRTKIIDQRQLTLF